MKVTTRVEIATDLNETDTIEISKIERRYFELDPTKIGLSLAEGKDALHKLQQIFVAARAEGACTIRCFCSHCHRRLELKDRRIRRVNTVLGAVRFQSARIMSCPCETFYQLEMPYSPMTEYVPEQAIGELIALEAKLSAQMPYRQAAATIRELLPARSTLNHVSVRNRVLRAGTCVEAVPPAIMH